jgi:undecaprenyl-diphosphatase
MDAAEAILAWIGQHPDSAGWMVLSVALLESLVVVGLVVPGWAILVGVGALIGSGHLPFMPTATYAFMGAVAGESLGYFLGWHYRERIEHWGPVARHHRWLESSREFFAKHGAASVALGRFFGPVRAFVPLIAGVSGMRPLPFMLINVLSAAVWAPAYLLPGVVAGASVSLPGNDLIWIGAWSLGSLTALWLAGKAWWRRHQGDDVAWQSIALRLGAAALCTAGLMSGPWVRTAERLVSLVWAVVMESGSPG